MNSGLRSRNRVGTFFPIAFEVGSKRAHDSLHCPGSASGLLSLSKHGKGGLVFAQSNQRGAIEVIGTLFAIVIERASIISQQEVSMRGAGHQVGIQMSPTKVSSNGS